ncbi:pyridoxamine 5'-phosphate oxidase family protein [Acuticoccus mangrovi]|uniref:Pyridoxamine 5'-phosphate oxidase family protein n=1 Tax=Acuticoccus mangrovi TaxID=2796142 RepID=A0A934IP80_9HYPH|nr:pyridoxamine 5'-phosphate oxidase family protein [Acuticoccus mangrovi]MBJ3776033.1 pyridoxamine 5'-phosphate oxidase family protein [Acuticoccus mangrovi]
MPKFICTEAELLAHYGTPKPPSLVKVAPTITPHYRAWIEASPFFAFASVGPEGLDCSPRGDEGSAVTIVDERTLAIPDRRGNDRIDTLRNIVRDPRVALMFLIPGSGTVLRVNGEAAITADNDVLERYAVHGKAPRTVVFVTVREVYFQCARAVNRAKLWEGGHADLASLPSVGAILEELSQATIDGDTYDAEWPGRAANSMW